MLLAVALSSDFTLKAQLVLILKKRNKIKLLLMVLLQQM